MALIIKAAATGGQEDTAPFHREPAFAASGGRITPRVPPSQVPAFCDYYAYRILRRPGDLSAHLARILLLARVGGGTTLHGAILDLFRVLGERGLSLRQDVLRRCASRLDEAARQQLERFLDHPERLPAETEGIPGLVSSPGSGPRLSVPVGQETRETGDPVTEAEDHLQYGNVEAAVSLLRNRLLDDPADERAGALLLEVFRHAGDLERGRAWHRRMLDTGAENSRWWQELGQWLEEAE